MIKSGAGGGVPVTIGIGLLKPSETLMPKVQRSLAGG